MNRGMASRYSQNATTSKIERSWPTRVLWVTRSSRANWQSFYEQTLDPMHAMELQTNRPPWNEGYEVLHFPRRTTGEQSGENRSHLCFHHGECRKISQVGNQINELNPTRIGSHAKEGWTLFKAATTLCTEGTLALVKNTWITPVLINSLYCLTFTSSVGIKGEVELGLLGWKD